MHTKQIAQIIRILSNIFMRLFQEYFHTRSFRYISWENSGAHVNWLYWVVWIKRVAHPCWILFSSFHFTFLLKVRKEIKYQHRERMVNKKTFVRFFLHQFRFTSRTPVLFIPFVLYTMKPTWAKQLHHFVGNHNVREHFNFIQRHMMKWIIISALRFQIVVVNTYLFSW